MENPTAYSEPDTATIQTAFGPDYIPPFGWPPPSNLTSMHSLIRNALEEPEPPVSFPLPPMAFPARIKGKTLAVDTEQLINQRLPKELLLRVFSYLDVQSLCRCAAVCRYWKTLANDGSNWQSVNLMNFQRDIDQTVAENISKRCGTFLRTLSLLGCWNVKDSATRAFALHCPYIESLRLCDCRSITDATCQALNQFSQRLRFLDLRSCRGISDKSITSLGSGCPHIESLNLSFCELITDSGLQSIANAPFAKHLRVLHLAGILQITDNGISAIANNCKELITLNITNCTNLRDRSLTAIGQNLRFLENLCIARCLRFTDQGIVAIAHGCPRLKLLEAAGCENLTDVGLIQIARHCEVLERLDIEDCLMITDGTLITLAHHCHYLTHLIVARCEQVTDEGIRALAGSVAAAETLTDLGLDNLPLITDAALDHLQSCLALQKVDLFDCQLLSRSAIRRLKNRHPALRVQAYFAPQSPQAGRDPQARNRDRRRRICRFCRCCTIM